MEEIFTKTEYEKLLKNTSWSDESVPSGDCPWTKEMKKITMVFPFSGSAPYACPAAADGGISSVFFSFFLPYIDESAAMICTAAEIDRDRLLLPEALKEYKNGCLSFCTAHWSSVCSTVLRKAGYNPFSVSPDPEVFRYISSGKCFHDCCMEYPMFARFFAEYMISVRNELSELIINLYNHRIMTYRKLFDFCADEKTVPVVECIGGALSDRHNGGRSVHIITFADGKKVAYKPHSSRMDLAFAGWLDYLTDVSGERPFERADSVDFNTCSFYRFISPHQFHSQKETAEFFYREGFLLGAVFSLCGHDLHSENIIAAKDPVIVDGETLVEVPEPEFCSSYGVMSTALLPLCSSHPGYHREPCGSCDTGAGSLNLPLLDGTPCKAYEFPGEMVSGFQASMNAVLSNRRAAVERIRCLFTGVKTRKLILPSYSYEHTLLAINTPGRLVSSCEVEHALNILLERRAEESSEVLEREARIRFERDAMRQLDIPILFVTLEDEDIGKIAARLEDMNGNDIQKQIRYMSFLLDKSNPLCRYRLCNGGETAEDTLLQRLAEDTLKSFDSGYHIAVPREDGEPCFALEGTAFLEGKLGAAVALAGYLSCFEGSSDPLLETIRLRLQDYIRGLARRKDSRMAFSILEPGLAEGMGGMLAGAYLLFRRGLIDQGLFDAAAEGIMNSLLKALDSGRVFSFTHSFLYGFNGLKYALSRIFELGGISAEISARAEKISMQLGRIIGYPEESAKDMLHAEMEEAALRFDSSRIVMELSLPFPGLFFGTSGRLFRLCAEYRRAASTETDPFFGFFD